MGLVPVSRSARRYSSRKGEIGGAPADLVNRDFRAANPNDHSDNEVQQNVTVPSESGPSRHFAI